MKMQALENSREMFLQMTLVYVVDVLLLQTGNQVLEDHLLTPSDKKRRNNLFTVHEWTFNRLATSHWLTPARCIAIALFYILSF